jgi:hypothetical protein
MRAKYSPIIPIARSWTPESILIVAAKKVNPCTGEPDMKNFRTTYIIIEKPNSDANRPAKLAIRNGRVLNPVIILSA